MTLRHKHTFAILAVAASVPELLAGEPGQQSTPVTVTAASVRQDLGSDTLRADGNVVVTYQNVELHGDALEADLRTNQAHLSGRVELRMESQTVRGESLTLDMKTKEWHSGSARVSLAPDFFTEGVSAPLFATGAVFEGSPAGVRARGTKATSCDLDDAHYGLVAQSVTIVPDDKLVARNVKFRVGHTTIAQVPRYVISLKPRRRRQSLVPVVGYNDVEGAFVKTSYNYRADESGLGTLYFDAMQKRGFGVGVEHEYTADPYWGVAYLYGLRDRQTGSTEVNGRWRHRHRLTDTLEAQLALNFTRNNAFFARSASTLNGELTLLRNTESDQSVMTIRQQRSSGFGTRTNTTGSLRHRTRLSESLTANLTSNYRSIDLGPGVSADQELNTTVELEKRGERMDIVCRLEDRLDLDGDAYEGDNFVFAFERLPELTFRSDNVRLGTNELFGVFPFDAEVGLGSFRELPSGQSLTRTAFAANLRTYQHELSGSTDLRVGGGFRQALYSNDTAQYVVNYRSELDADLSRRWNFNLGYRKQQPAGHTPFRQDFASRYESVDAHLSFMQDRRQQFNVSTGYDLERRRFRDLIFRYQLEPNDTYYLSFSGGYDLENSEFRDLITRVEAWNEEHFGIDLTTRYSPLFGQMARINTQVYWRPHRWWQVEALSGWNGFTNRFDFNQFKLTRDLHCWEAYLTWDQQRREVRLDLAIKAFPAFDTRFGVGRSGQGLNTSVGQVF